jgi:phage recombination protein Bet
MTQAIERVADLPAVNGKRISNLAQVTGFNDRVIQLIRQTVCPGASALELATFLYNARRLGLDPMTRQIYFIKYDPKAPGEIVVGINGYRAQAEESGCYAGSDEAVYEYEQVGQPGGAPSKATVTVWKIVAGQRVPFTAAARWEEFYPGEGKKGEQYRKRPHNQLAIRAESHALRKGFPQQTERLQMQPPPAAWEQAVEADERARDDPDKIARDARTYDQVFAVEEDVVVSGGRVVDRQTGEVLSEPSSAQDLTAPEPSGAAAPPSPVAPPDQENPLIGKYRRNRELIKRARELGIDGFEPLALGKAEDVVEAANLELEDRIARYEFEHGEVERQKASEGLL